MSKKKKEKVGEPIDAEMLDSDLPEEVVDVEAEAAPEETAMPEAAAPAKEEPKEALRQVVMVVPKVNMSVSSEIQMVIGLPVEIPVSEYERLKADARGPFFEE